MNHLLIAILILISLALAPQSDPECKARCEAGCGRASVAGVDLLDASVQDPEEPEDVDTDEEAVDGDLAELEVLGDLDSLDVDVDLDDMELPDGVDMREIERAVREATRAAERAGKEAAEAAERAGEEASEAAERAAAEAEEAAERAADEAEEAAERAADEAQEAAERAAEEVEAAHRGQGHRDCSAAKARCVQNQSELKKLVEAARAGQGSSCQKSKRAKEISQLDKAQAEKALAALARVQGSTDYQRALELAQNQGALAQVLAVKGAEAGEAQQQLDLLSRLGYSGAASRPLMSTREGGQSRSLEDRIHALEQRLGIEDGDAQSLEKRVEELERRLENSPRVLRAGPGAFTRPRAVVVPQPDGQTVVVPRTPTAPRAVTVIPRGKKAKSKVSAPSAPDTTVDENETPAPHSWSSGPFMISPRTAPLAPTPGAAPAPPSLPSPPSPGDAPSPMMMLRRPGADGMNISGDRRREIESMMQRMRDEMEHLRSEMDRLRNDLQNSARERRTR